MENSDLSAMIGKIMQNPEFAGMISEMRGKQESAADVSKDMMSHLDEVVKMAGPMLGGIGEKEQPKPEPAESSEQGGTKAPFKMPYSREERVRAEKLMQALKPYLNKSRCEIIDKCMSVMQLGDVVGALQGLENLKL